jgi:hypothetical protein
MRSAFEQCSSTIAFDRKYQSDRKKRWDKFEAAWLKKYKSGFTKKRGGG